MRGLLRRTPTCALHIHVGMPDPETAIRAFNRMRQHLPALQALAAHSPYWHGIDSGFQTARRLLDRSLLLAPFAISRINIAAITLFILGVASSEGSAYLQKVNSNVHDIDTEYSRVQVFETKDPNTGRPIRGLATDPYFVQSATFLDSDDLVLEYANMCIILSATSNPTSSTPSSSAEPATPSPENTSAPTHKPPSTWSKSTPA